MNKAELLDALSGQTGQTKDEVSKTLDALLDIIGSTLAKGDKLLLVGFGTFETQHRATRAGRNPRRALPLKLPRSHCPSSVQARR